VKSRGMRWFVDVGLGSTLLLFVEAEILRTVNPDLLDLKPPNKNLLGLLIT